MGLYFGSSKRKITSNNMTCLLHFFIESSNPNAENNIRLLSSDNYILKDFNNRFLIPKEVDK